jgi:hypothetical protein
LTVRRRSRITTGKGFFGEPLSLCGNLLQQLLPMLAQVCHTKAGHTPRSVDD